MGILARIPEPVRKALVSAAPDPLVGWARRSLSRDFDPLVSVARESAPRRWFWRHVMRRYLPSMVSRQTRLTRWFSTRVLGRRPRLFHFEIHITDHCNLNCKGCGHFSNLCEPSFLGLDAFRSDMTAVAQRLDVEQVFILGGEPLLHPRVEEFVRVARTCFPTTRIYLMTNGTLVTRMGPTFWRALAETDTVLLCDLYPIQLPRGRIDARGAESGVKVEWTGYRDKFFKLPIDVEGRQDAADSFKRCSGVCNCPMVRDGRIYPCAYAAYADVLSTRFGLEGIEADDADSRSVHDDSDPRELMDFLLGPIPWCRHCDFDSFSMFPWDRSRRELSEWVCEPAAVEQPSHAESVGSEPQALVDQRHEVPGGDIRGRGAR